VSRPKAKEVPATHLAGLFFRECRAFVQSLKVEQIDPVGNIPQIRSVY
jgi:hypothetical protein